MWYAMERSSMPTAPIRAFREFVVLLSFSALNRASVEPRFKQLAPRATTALRLWSSATASEECPQLLELRIGLSEPSAESESRFTNASCPTASTSQRYRSTPASPAHSRRRL